MKFSIRLATYFISVWTHNSFLFLFLFCPVGYNSISIYFDALIVLNLASGSPLTQASVSF